MINSQPIFKVLVSLVVVVSSVVFADPIETYFSKPYTGSRVGSYSVELPISNQNKQTFKVPEECTKIDRFFAEGAAQWGPKIERFLWLKVVNDCHYVHIIHSGYIDGIKDFISDYDFWNASISSFPMRWGCVDEDSSMGKNCDSMESGIPDISRLPAFQQGEPDSDKLTKAACQMENGVFRGKILYSSEGLFCKKEVRGPGFRIRSVNFADVNKDGYMDAIIRLIPIGRSVSRIPILYMLTKFDADGGFLPLPK